MTDPKLPVPDKTDEALLEPPPILGSWPAMYAAVIGILVVVVTGLWIVTQVFS